MLDRRSVLIAAGKMPARSVLATSGDRHHNDDSHNDKCQEQRDFDPPRSRWGLRRTITHEPSLIQLAESLRDILYLSNTPCIVLTMPKLWAQTVESHRHEVREAIQEATVELVGERGLRSVTMSEIAERTGIGRATLYKYFPDVESILQAWHEHQIEGHLQELAQASESADSPLERVVAVLSAYAFIAHGSRGHRDTELAALLHGHHESHRHAEEHLRQMVRDLLRDAAATGAVRGNVSADELTEYCLSALSAAGRLASRAAVGRLVEITIAALRPES
jgi:AcrR family transcriptional regulator